MWGHNLDLDFIKDVSEVKVPIYFCAGRYDYNTLVGISSPGASTAKEVGLYVTSSETLDVILILQNS